MKIMRRSLGLAADEGEAFRLASGPSSSFNVMDTDVDWKDVQTDGTLHQHKGQIPYDGEAPMNECMALAHAIALPRGATPSASEIADAALTLVDLRSAGWDVKSGFALQPISRVAPILCTVLCAVRKKKPTPRDQVESENYVSELRSMAFDIFRKAGE